MYSTYFLVSLIFLCLACSIPEIPEKESPYQEILTARYQALINLGQKYRRIEPKQSIEYYNKAIEIYPNHPTAYYGRGETQSELKQYSLAISDYDKSIESEWSLDIIQYKYLVYCARATARIRILRNVDKNDDTYPLMYGYILVDLEMATRLAVAFKASGAMEIIEEVRALLDD